MKTKPIVLLLILSVLCIRCSLIDIEHGYDSFVELEGKWKLISITFNGEQNITPCDKTTISEFKFDTVKNKDPWDFDYSGDYEGTTYFWTEALDSCNPETFTGRWDWDDKDVAFTLSINGSDLNPNYSNDFDISFIYDGDDLENGKIANKISLRFKNEDEVFERIYLYERLP